MNAKIKTFTDLNAWREGHKLVLMVYETTKKFLESETFSIVNQMRRGVASITANIAEGFGRKTYKEKLQFYYMAQGSLIELKNFILISKDVGYLNEEDFEKLVEQANLSHKLLQGLMTKTKSFISLKS